MIGNGSPPATRNAVPLVDCPAFSTYGASGLTTVIEVPGSAPEMGRRPGNSDHGCQTTRAVRAEGGAVDERDGVPRGRRRSVPDHPRALRPVPEFRGRGRVGDRPVGFREMGR